MEGDGADKGYVGDEERSIESVAVVLGRVGGVEGTARMPCGSVEARPVTYVSVFVGSVRGV